MNLKPERGKNRSDTSQECFKSPKNRSGISKYTAKGGIDLGKYVIPFLFGLLTSAGIGWATLIRDIPSRTEMKATIQEEVKDSIASFLTEKQLEEILLKKTPYIRDKPVILERIRENKTEIKEIKNDQIMILRKLDVLISHMERLDKKIDP